MWTAIIVIILAVILIFISLLFAKIGVELAYDKEVKVFIKLGFFKIRVFPLPKLKLGFRRRSMSRREAERIRKRLEKKQAEKDKAKQEKAAKKKAPKKKKKEEKGSGISVSEVLDIIKKSTDILKRLSSLLRKHLILKLARLKVKIGTPDAATTAIAYGAVTQSINVLFPILDEIDNFAIPSGRNIKVEADFLSEECTLDLCFSFSLRVMHIIKIFFASIYEAIIFYIDYAKGNRKKDTPEEQPKKKQKNKKKQRNPIKRKV